MFTGIIEKVAPVVSIEQENHQAKLTLFCNFSTPVLGESIAVNGVCLTLARMHSNGLNEFYISPETLQRTNFAKLKKGDLVNLERSMKLGDRISGHWVQGHVDTVAPILKLAAQGDAYLLEILLPQDKTLYCVEKGSIAVNGTSLTINSVSESGLIQIQLVPHTWQQTNFSSLHVGNLVNIELDILAKYIEKQASYLMKERLHAVLHSKGD